jgi:uncharacterized protein (DUF427 family)
MKANWKDATIAESNNTVVIEGNHYFPPDAVNMKYMMPSETKTKCPWKGDASYYTINVGGELNTDAAWYYPEPKEAAKNIQGYIAFWHGVEIIE